MLQIFFCMAIFCDITSAYWDMGTTTEAVQIEDDVPRTSFFRWQWCVLPFGYSWYYNLAELDKTHRLNCIAGMSIDNKPINTAIILNRRVLISSYNPYAGFMNRQEDIRIWALSLGNAHDTPYRYRVYRITRLFPESGNPEHCHGPRCLHQPRHDVAIIICQDQLYLRISRIDSWAEKTFLTSKTQTLAEEIWFAGSGYKTKYHVVTNYRIRFSVLRRDDVVDCSMYLPKWWGKFICVKNLEGFTGVQSGGGFFTDTTLVGLGCFELRSNEDRILVFTDLRYYITYIEHYANITPGQYYEYAYPQWGGKLHDGPDNPVMSISQIQDDFFPLGR